MDRQKAIETLKAVYSSLDAVTVSGQKNMSIILGCMQAIQDVAQDISSDGDTAEKNV